MNVQQGKAVQKVWRNETGWELGGKESIKGWARWLSQSERF